MPGGAEPHGPALEPVLSPERKPHAETQPEERPWRWRVSTLYLLAMGVCGVVLVALGATLDDLARHCGASSLGIATVFLARGGGAIGGALASGRLYSAFHGHRVLPVALAILASILAVLPTCRNAALLHALFFGLGASAAVVDTGVQVLSAVEGLTMPCPITRCTALQFLAWPACPSSLVIFSSLCPLLAFLSGPLGASIFFLVSVGGRDASTILPR